VEAKLKAALELEPRVDFVAVHRDANSAGREARIDEIQRAVDALDLTIPVLPVIPVRELEAWLLLDEAAIRQVAGNPRGRGSLNLPGPGRVERLPNPKRVLQDALHAANPVTGRRARQLRRDFPHHRQRLLELLDRDGPVKELESWQYLKQQLTEVVEALVKVGRR